MIANLNTLSASLQCLAKKVVCGKTSILISRPKDHHQSPGWVPQLNERLNKKQIVTSVKVSLATTLPLTSAPLSKCKQQSILLFGIAGGYFINSEWATIQSGANKKSRAGIESSGKSIRRGSAVIVHKPQNVNQAPYWVPKMDILDGKTVVVNKVLPSRKYVECKFKGNNLRYMLNIEWLEKKIRVRVEKKQLATPVMASIEKPKKTKAARAAVKKVISIGKKRPRGKKRRLHRG